MGTNEYLPISLKNVNADTDLFCLTKVKKGKFFPSKSKGSITKKLFTSRLKSYKFLILLKSTWDLWSPWQRRSIQPSDCLQWISDKTKWKWIDVILMQKWAWRGGPLGSYLNKANRADKRLATVNDIVRKKLSTSLQSVCSCRTNRMCVASPGFVNGRARGREWENSRYQLPLQPCYN